MPQGKVTRGSSCLPSPSVDSIGSKAGALKTTLCQIRNSLFFDYLKTELNNPKITAYSGL